MKARRQRIIRELVESSRVATHDKLAEALAGRGVNVSQSTLSRDLRELGIVKTQDGYQFTGRSDPGSRAEDELAAAVSRFMVGLATAHNLVILRTDPGGASALAQFLDSARWPEIVGTIAGDDTIFAATRDARTATRVRDMLEGL